ncbi:MAG: Uma2 family endonuclease [Gammaproteobacteria bacterium]|nr:Uma2 family endonuclease [Gammaproteobacteria bacterium]
MDATPEATLLPVRRGGYGHHPLRVDALASLPLLLRLPFRSTDDWLYELCQANDVLRIERTVEGDLIIGPPAGFKTSHRNANIVMQLVQWAARDGTGSATESSGGFVLPDTSMFAPDAGWFDTSASMR